MEAGREARGGLREALIQGGQLAGVWALTVVQPTFSILRSAELFVLFEWNAAHIVLYALGFAFLPPAALLGLELLAGLVSRRLRAILHAFLLAGLVAAYAGYLVRFKVPEATALTVGLVVLAVWVATGFGFWRYGTLRSFATALSPAPLVVLALFLFGSPVTQLLFPDEATPTPAMTARAPVVMVVFDEFPVSSLLDGSGRLDMRTYPSFGELARRATWFRSATTVHDHTTAALPAILSGRYSQPDETASAASHPDNLFTLLDDAYELHVVESATALCPRSLCPPERSRVGRFRWALPFLTALSLGNYLPGEVVGRFPGANIGLVGSPTDDLRRMIGSIFPSRAPTLHFVHAQIPHQPWSYLPSGAAYEPVTTTAGAQPPVKNPLSPGIPAHRWLGDRHLLDQLRQRHLAQVRFADRVIGDVLDRLKDTGLYDRALVVVTADHGISFRPNGLARLTSSSNAGDIVRVPLFVKAPGQRKGAIDNRLVRSIDIVPTIADLLGITVPWSTEGRSVLDDGYTPPRSLSVSRTTEGDRLDLRPALLEKQVQETAKHNARLFGSTARGALDVFAFGPRRELLGKRVSEVPIDEREGQAFRLDNPTAFGNIDPQGAVLPAIAGTVTGPGGDAGRYVAVAVNGRIAAIAPTRSTPEGEAFSAIVPPSAYRRGQNDVGVYAMSRDSRRLIGPPSGPRPAAGDS